MSAIFLSHSSKDNAIAADVRIELERRGHRSVFLDFDPENGIPAGRDWEKELYSELRGCQAFIVLCSEHSMSSSWCFHEIACARGLLKEIFPVIISPCTIGSVLRQLQTIDLTIDRNGAFDRLERGLLEAGLDPASMFHWDGSKPPYPGLLAFQETDAAIYFGRDPDIRESLEVLNTVHHHGGERFIVMLGASGSGKSSLMRAGIIPRLKYDTERWLVIDPFRPKQHPIQELAVAISHTFERYHLKRDWRQLKELLEKAAKQKDESVLLGFVEELRIESKQRDASVLLPIDQIEELLTANLSDQTNEFMVLLFKALKATNSPLLALGTLRSDFLGRLQTFPAMVATKFKTIPVGPMSIEAYAAVIEGPAVKAGLKLETGLVHAMVNDTKTNDALPLLAFTLRELYEKCGPDKILSVDDYKNLGRSDGDAARNGLEGAVARSANAVMEALKPSEEDEKNLRDAFVAMVRIDEDGQYARQPISKEILGSELLKKFEDKRLLISRGDEDQGPVFEVAHESLFRVWNKLKKWLDEDRQNIHLRDNIQHAAVDWHAGGRKSHLLNHREGRLVDAENLIAKKRFKLDPLFEEYIAAAVKLRTDNEDRAKRNSFLKNLGLGLVTLLACVAAFFAYQSNKSKEEATAQLAKTHWVSGVNLRDQKDKPLQAAHHLMAAADLDKSNRGSNAYLAGGLIARGAKLIDILDHQNIQDISFSSDGQKLLTWSEDKDVKINVWDLNEMPAKNTTLDTCPNIPHESECNPLELATLSADGQYVLLVRGKLAEVWEVATASRLGCTTHPYMVRGAIFYSNAERVISWGQAGSVKFWKVNDLNCLNEANGDASAVANKSHHTGRVLGATVNETNERALSWSISDANVKFWNAKTGKEIGKVPHDFKDDCAGIAAGDFLECRIKISTFCPDPDYILTVSGNFVRVFKIDLENFKNHKLVLEEKQENVIEAQCVTNQRALSWGGREAILWEWDQQGTKVVTSVGHAEKIRRASIDSNVSRIFTWSDDDTAKFSQINKDGSVTVRHHDNVLGAVLDAKQKSILTWSKDKSARVWDVTTGQPVTPPLMHTKPIKRAMFNAKSNQIVTVGKNGEARIWAFAPLPPVSMETRTSLAGGLLDQDDEGRYELSYCCATPDHDGRCTESFNKENWLKLKLADRATDHIECLAKDGDLQNALSRSNEIQGGVISADKEHILTWYSDAIEGAQVWENHSKTQFSPPLASGSRVHGGGFSIGNDKVLTWYEDGSVRLWDSRSGYPIVVLMNHIQQVEGSVISSDNKFIASWSIDGTAFISSLQLEPAIALAPVGKLALEFQRRTGTQLDHTDALKVLSREEWIAIKRENW